jgi:flagellar biosynthesis protein FlhF
MRTSANTTESVLQDNPALRQEFDELKDMVKNLAGELTRIETKQSKPQETPPYNPLASLEQKLRTSKKNNKIEKVLLSHGINQETANIISGFAHEHLLESDLEDEQKIHSFLHETIADIFNIQVPEFTKNTEQKRMAFIGPTGVGKTTTLAKIAANYLAAHSNSIALITIDTYRIAAVEQLKVYGEIMHLPVEVVINPQQLVEALEKHSDKELILIDTAGRSPQDSLSIEEIQSFFPEDLEIENHLVLSATTRDNELLETLKSFKRFSIHSTIFTKTDECTSLGVLLNTQIQNSTPLSYITNGQRVPEDIIEADKRILAQLIIPSATE